MSEGMGRPVRLGLVTKLFYGFGSVAFGVKDNGFQTFLLVFYSQMIGLPAHLVGLALMIAMMIDAVFDPLIGQVSDTFRSPWGRRHPFMYGAALPVAIFYLVLWHPPHGLSNGMLFAYLLVVTVVVRTFITLYEIPSSALAPELSRDYDQRTNILGYRYFFGWWGGLGMTLLAYSVFLKPTAKYPVGQLNPDGYHAYSVTAAIVMFCAILISAAGTHRWIPVLRQAPIPARRSPLAVLKEMATTLANRSFVMVVVAALFAAIGQGIAFALTIFMGTFLWRLTSGQMSLTIANALVGALIATLIAPRAARRLGKKTAAFWLIAASVVLGSTPVVLRLLGLFWPNFSPALLPTILAFGVVQASLGIAGSILVGSMIADVVEDSEVATGRRSEGLFFAANSLVQKSVSGMGVFFSGLILAFVRFPAHADPATVDPEIVRRLAMTYIPVHAAFYVVGLAFLAAYRIDRGRHQDNLAQLAAKAAATEMPPLAEQP